MGRLAHLITACALGAMLMVPAVVVGGATQGHPGKVVKRVGIAHIDGAQGTVGTSEVRCKRGTRLVSGGWAMTDAEETGLAVFESRRLGRRGWTVSAIQSTATSFDTDLLSFAFCDKDARRAKRVTATGSVEPGETGSVESECPKRTKAVAGGFLIPVDSDFNEGGLPVESRRVGKRTWRVAAYSPNPEGATVTTEVYCSGRAGRLRTRSDTTPIGESGDYAFTSSRKCPKRIGARAGGFSFENLTDAQFSIPFSYLEGRRWRVSARNFGAPPTELRSFAYCP